MITEQELKAMCTPDIIKKMVELAEGFEIIFESIDGIVAFRLVDSSRWYSKESTIGFSTLIHRAVEEWNFTYNKIAFYPDQLVRNWNDGMMNRCNYPYSEYQPETLTKLECALLHCLIEILKEGGSMSEARDEFYSIKSICSMKVVNYVNEIEAENANLKSYNQLKIDSSLKVVQLEEDKAELIKFIEKVEYMIPMSLYPTIKNGATEILRKF